MVACCWFGAKFNRKRLKRVQSYSFQSRIGVFVFVEEQVLVFPEALELTLQLGGTRLRDEQRAFPKQALQRQSTP